MTHSPLRLKAAYDRSHVNERGDSVRYLVVELQAPDMDACRPRVPLNLGLVIDRSGSMSGRRLEDAKTAAAGVIDRLSEDDHLSLVCFDDEVDVLAPATPLGTDEKERLCQRLARLQARRSTDLGAGWLTGVETVAAAQSDLEGHRHHVIVLSDGQANRGIVDPGELAKHAAQLLERGISSSSVGIGDDYSPIQLQAIAEAGGGDLHDAEHPEEIVEVVLGELDSLGEIVADDVRLAVTLPSGAQAELFGSEPVLHRGSHLQVSLGSMRAAVKRTVVLKITMPAGRRDDAAVTTLEADWRVPGEDERLSSDSAEAILTFGRPPRGGWPIDECLHAVVARRWQSWIVREAMRLNGDGCYEDAERLVDDQLRYFADYVRDLREGDRLLQELSLTGRVSSRRMRERSRKEILFAHHKMSSMRPDRRSLKREEWASFLKSD